MNKTVEDFMRNQIKNGLKQLPDSWKELFKRMYSHKDLSKDINKVVDDMPIEKLDWALSQVENSMKKMEKSK